VDRIEAVLFDWGGVLIDDPAPGLMAYCARELGVSVEDYSQAHDRYSELFQKGRIEEGEFWQRVCGDLKRPLPRAASLWGQAFRSVYAPRADVFELARRIHACGYKTGMVSNTEAVVHAFARQFRYRAFDAIVLSCAVGAMKPEREIYELAAAKLRIAPQQCAFIDDRPPFIAGAVATGMTGILYKSAPQLVKDLAALGVSANGEPALNG
jgi:epoxide hydrolase-like predicted phosphatase